MKLVLDFFISHSWSTWEVLGGAEGKTGRDKMLRHKANEKDTHDVLTTVSSSLVSEILLLPDNKLQEVK